MNIFASARILTIGLAASLSLPAFAALKAGDAAPEFTPRPRWPASRSPTR